MCADKNTISIINIINSTALYTIFVYKVNIKYWFILYVIVTLIVLYLYYNCVINLLNDIKKKTILILFFYWHF